MRRKYGVTGLGLVASGRRNIVEGKAFDTLYAKEELLGTNPIIGGDLSDTYDTLNYMSDIVHKTLNDTKKVAATLIAKSVEHTLLNDWNHVYNHFQYAKDATGIEQIRRPSRSWIDRKRGIDCDCMSVLLSSILTNQGISHAFRKAAYNEVTGWQHVYVIVPKKGISLNAFTGNKKVARDNYYVLDCVVDKFNYEVPFIEKFDKVMKVQYLNGLDAATMNGGVTSSLANGFIYNSSASDLLSGFGYEWDALHAVNGLGSTPTEFAILFLAGLKQHLINTRKILALYPGLTDSVYNTSLFIQRLDALISVFDDANERNRVLTAIANAEVGDKGLNGLDGFFKKIKSAVTSVAKAVTRPAATIKTVANKVADVTKSVAHKVADVAKTVATKAVEVVKKAAKFVVRYNPATALIRNGLLLAMRINLFRLAEKLGYGYWTEQEAKAKGLDMAEFKKNQDILERVKKIHRGLGGKLDKLESAIRAGWRHGVNKHNLLQGLGETTAKSKKQNILALKSVNAASPLLMLVEQQLRSVNPGKIIRTPTSTNELQTLYQAIRTNRNGLATKLSLGYKPASEIKLYDTKEYAKLSNVLKSIERMVVQRGGSVAEFRSAIDAGKKVALTKQSLGEAATASTAAAGSVLATIAKWLSSNVNFTTMFKGRGTSPNATETEINNGHTSQELDEIIFDEGDPNNSSQPVDTLLQQITPPAPPQTVLTQVLKSLVPMQMAQSIPAVSSLVESFKSNPIEAQAAAKAINSDDQKEIQRLVQNPIVAGMVEKITDNPVAATIATRAVAQENPAVGNDLTQALVKTVPTETAAAQAMMQQKAVEIVKENPGAKSAVEIQDAIVLDSKINETKDEGSNTLMYLGLGAAALTIAYLASRSSSVTKEETTTPPETSNKPNPEPAPEPIKTLSGAKSKKAKRHKNVMAITI